MSTAESRTTTHYGSTAMLAETHRGGVEVIERWADSWRSLCAESVDDQPFYRPEWIAAHIRAFTPGAKVILLTVSCGEKLFFVLPLLQERSSLNGVPVRKLVAPVNSHSCRFDAVRHAGPEGDAVLAAAWSHLQSLKDWDVLELSDAPEGGTISKLVALATESRYETAQVPMRRNPYVPIPSDAAGLAQLPVNKRLRTKLRSIRRDLAENNQLKFWRSTDPSEMAPFYELESAGWKGEEKSAIKCNPETRQFYEEASRAAERFGYLAIYSLELNGQLLASHFGLEYKGRYFSPKIAYNEELSQYAPGHLIVSEILADCASRGIAEYDITGVNDDWKMKWTSEVRSKFIYFVFQKGLAGTLAHTVRFRLRPAVKKLVKVFTLCMAGCLLHLLFQGASGIGAL